MTRQEVVAALESLQVWFAGKPYGWRERATPEQLQQWEDREREQEYLIGILERMGG